MKGKLLPEPMRLMGDENTKFKPLTGSNEPLLLVKNLTTRFAVKSGFLRRTVANVHAVAGVSFKLMKGKTLSLVGESGCGKSTIGRSLLRLVEPLSGHVTIDGQDIVAMSPPQLREARLNMQMVFQDPFS